MQDRFKFRAFDISDKCYVKVTQLNFDANDNLPAMEFIKPKSIDPDGFKYVCYQDQLDKFIFEQCTGLKDKNGKLIYEGDIVRVDSGVYDVKALTLVVRFHNGAFMVGDRFIDNNSKFMECIGNIHENPELLKKY